MRTLYRAAIVAVALLGTASSRAGTPTTGVIAPDFRLTLLDGSKVSLADLRGQVIILNFWATWCGPCKKELPLLDAYYKVQQAAGLRVFAITTEDSLPLSRLQPLAAALTIPMVRHLTGSYAPLGAVPTNYIIDRAGVLRYAKAAALQLDDLNTILAPLLSEATAAPLARAAGVTVNPAAPSAR